jgi:hypothetical protein
MGISMHAALLRLLGLAALAGLVIALGVLSSALVMGAGR